MEIDATLPSIGQTWLADLGPDTPLGHFTVEITFNSATSVTYLATGGTLEGQTETMDYTAVKLRDGLYAVRWTEQNGDMVTHIEDYDQGTCMASSVVRGQFVQLNGTWTRVR
ncbi:MoaF-related domain-containing protein [Nocardia pseudovaccinii]|uniref:MoaF-related domain-containing protein n=1 Tax=Nocardia pseudovaccinii TaxID=189540 RepID=UPI0007A5207C|nr:hypothetical protein [Nocardia pseudovaccinii]